MATKQESHIRNRITQTFVISLFSIVLLPLPVSANAGVPMIVLSFPVMLMALVPIIFLESYFYRRAIAVKFKKSIISSGTANAVSTIAGFPLAWGSLFLLELFKTGGSCGPGFDTVSDGIITVLVESAWLCPWEDHLHWLMPVAFINSLIVAFFISVGIEYFIMKKFFRDHNKAVIRKTTYVANSVSYLLLIALAGGFLVYALVAS